MSHLKFVFASLVALILMPVGAFAQTLHNYPGKAAYLSPAEWPFWSDQCHWENDGFLSHTHIETNIPIYIEVKPGDKIRVPFTLKTFHGGRIETLWSENARITLNNWSGADVRYPNLQGDRNGVSTWTGVATFDTALNTTYGANAYVWSAHGWTELRIAARTRYPNGSTTEESLEFPVYSLLHPEVAEIPYPEGRVHPLRASCSPSPEGTGTGWGLMVTEFQGSTMVPIAPLALGQVWAVDMPKTYSYGVTPALPPGTFDRRLDPDLHNGISGLQLTSPIVFDTNVSGPGEHKFSFIWDTKSTLNGVTAPGFHAAGEAAALLVGTLTIGDGTAQPTCTDPAATNNGGPLPCTYPPLPSTPCVDGDSALFTFPQSGVTFREIVNSDCSIKSRLKQ